MTTDTSAAPPSTTAAKVGPIAGILFVVLFVASFMIMDTPDGDASDEEWLAYWDDDGNKTQGVLASITMLLAAVAFVWLIGSLRRRLSGTVGIDAAYASGIVLAALAAFAGFAAGLIPVGDMLADVPVPEDPDVVRLVDGGYFGVLFLAMPYAMAGFLIPLSYALRITGSVPKWLWIAGLVVGVIALTGPFLFFVPHLLTMIWLLILCIRILRQPATA